MGLLKLSDFLLVPEVLMIKSATKRDLLVNPIAAGCC